MSNNNGLTRNDSRDEFNRAQKSIQGLRLEISNLAALSNMNAQDAAKQSVKTQKELLKLEKRNLELLRDTKLESIGRAEKAEQNALNSLRRLQLENAQTITNIQSESLHRNSRAREQAELKLNNLKLDNEKKLTTIKSLSYKKDEIAQAKAEGRLSDLRISKLTHEANIRAEEVKRNETAQAISEDKLAALREENAKKLTALAESNLNLAEKVALEHEGKLTEKKIALQELVHKNALLNIYSEADAQIDADALVQQAKNDNLNKANQNRAKEKAALGLAVEYANSKQEDAKGQAIQSRIEAEGERNNRTAIAQEVSKSNIAATEADTEKKKTAIEVEQLNRQNGLRQTAENKLTAIEEENEKKTTALALANINAKEVAQKQAEGRILDLQTKNVNIEAEIEAESNNRSEIALNDAIGQISNLRLENEKLLTSIQTESLSRNEKATEQAQNRLNNLKLEHEKKLTEEKSLSYKQDEIAQATVENTLSNLRISKKKHENNLIAENLNRNEVAQAQSDEKIAALEEDNAKKLTKLKESQLNFEEKVILEHDGQITERKQALQDLLHKNALLAIYDEADARIDADILVQDAIRANQEKANQNKAKEEATSGLATEYAKSRQEDAKGQAIQSRIEAEGERNNRTAIAQEVSKASIVATESDTEKKLTAIEVEKNNRENGLDQLAKNGSVAVDEENEKKKTALAIARVNAVEVAQKQAEGRILDLQKQNVTTLAEVDAENNNRDELAQIQSNNRIAAIKKSIAEKATKIAEMQLDTDEKANVALDDRRQDRLIAHEEFLHEQRIHNLKTEEDYRQDGQQIVEDLIKANDKADEELLARKSAMVDIIQAKADSLVKNKELSIQTKTEDLAALKQANSSDQMLNDSITEMFLDLENTVEQNSFKLKTLRATYENAEYADRQNNLQRQNELSQLLINAQEAVNKALYEQDLDLTTRKGQLVAKRAQDEAILNDVDKKAQEYVSKIPLIGKKLGERGNILDVFKDLSVTSDKFGKTWTRAKAKEEKEKATSAREREGTKALTKDQIKDLTTVKPGEKQSEWDKYKALQAQAADGMIDKSKVQEQLDKMGITQAQADEAEAADAKKGTGYAKLANATAALADIAKKLDNLLDEISSYKGPIDTRLEGLKTLEKQFGSYYSKISFDFSSLMTSPLIKQKDLMDNLIKVVDKGIARDVEQMAMLETMHSKIATTFNVFDGTMLRLIRIQDYNTTAARLGMEASINAMLNEMYQTTEYLSDLASSVRSNLEEAQALMSGQEGVAFEYQVQKWMGSLYSVGMSNQGVSAIAEALGKLAAGDIEGITNGGASNLLVMAANNSNLSLEKILANGLDASETNVLLNNVVGYMNTLVDEANGNKVVQQQLAKVFGLTASDLRAVKNIIQEDFYSSTSMNKIFSIEKTSSAIDIYNNMLGSLYEQAGKLYNRMSMGELLGNVMSNVQFSVAAGEANNPALYVINKSADILNSFAGGIPIPYITAFGTGVDTKLTVSNIMKAGAMVGGFTSSLVSMIGSLISGSGAGWTGNSLLKMVGVEQKAGRDTRTSSSGSGSVVNASVTDMTESATAEGKDSSKKQAVSAKEESSEVSNETINNSIMSIYDLLKDVVNGTSALNVKINDQPVSVANNNSNWAWPATT